MQKGSNINGIKIPREVNTVIQKLNNAEFEGYIVGGCVRDAILGRIPEDWDITTNARPGDIKSLFEKTVDTGIRHGTVTIIIDGKRIETTTFRIDGRYVDGRRPDSVEFTSSLEADLSRRDFTINAIAYHPDRDFIDPFNGRHDIGERLVRTVGDPDERFGEDALRMLRAVRFAAQLDFSIAPDVIESIKSGSSLILNISRERVRDELTKILTSDHPVKFIMLRDTNLLQYILPEFEVCFNTLQKNPYHVYNVAMHTLSSISHVENDRILRWTMLLHDIGKPSTKITDESGVDHFYGHQAKSMEMSEVILKRLRFDSKSIKKICRLVKFHDREIIPTEKAVRKAVSSIGEDIFPELLKVREADKKAQSPQYLEQSLAEIQKVREIYEKIRENRHCISLNELKINGHDLIDLGYRPGREIKEMLVKLLELVIENPGMNDREKLIETVKNKSFYKEKDLP